MRLRSLNLVVCGLAGLASVCVSGCSSEPEAPKKSRDEVILECISEAGQKLDDAVATGTLASAASEIVRTLEDSEDFVSAPGAQPFGQFLRAAEQLQSMSGGEGEEEAIASRIAAAKMCAEEYLNAVGK